jgi:hypothetical protein
MRPMMLVRTPNTLLRNSGKMLITISLDMSMKKLVRLTAHTFLGNERQPVLWSEGSAWLIEFRLFSLCSIPNLLCQLY